ncbi:ATP-binding cassette domain-containing protein, partial [Actinomycetota bacterium]
RKVTLEVKNLRKYFGAIKANHDVSFKLYEGEIIAIVGDNGAGKSTTIKTISGVHKKDSGEIYINGELASIENTVDAIRYGIETVYQDEGLISVFEPSLNLFLGRFKLRKGILGKIFRFTDNEYMRDETVRLLERIGIELQDIRMELGNLSGGQRQSIKVGTAVYWGGKILIFDEPTNNLGAKQERKIIELIKKIRDEFNISIIIISHNIAHVFELVDRIIILRNGEVVGEKIKNQTNPNEIVSMITGIT